MPLSEKSAMDAKRVSSEATPVRRNLIRRILHEPLLHFLLIGAMLFGIAEWRDNASEPALKQIVLTEGDVEQLRIAMLAQGLPEPDPAQMRGLIDAKVREEVLYREAIAMGLDQDDTIIRRRLVQKMDFLAEDLSAMREPTQEELQQWMDEHPQEFALPPRVSFRHLYFSPDQRGADAPEAAADARRKLDELEAGSAEAAELGDRFMYQDYYADRTPEQVADVFGRPFAVDVFGLEPGIWSAPIGSGLGWHLVRVDSLTPGHVAELDEVEASVKLQWQEFRRKEFKAEAFDVMRAKYEVILPKSVLGSDPATPPSKEPRND